MKMNIRVVAILSLVLTLALSQPLQAQDEATAQKVRQQVVQMMQKMPLDAQLEVLKFTQRKKTEMDRQGAAQASDQAVAPQQAQARPAPERPQTVQVQSQTSNQPTPAKQPARPAYIEQAEAMQKTSVNWGETNHDFGNIKSGEVVKHTYRFTNTGDQPLKLTRVKASCGCTTPSWSKEAIAPGEEGFIEVAFNTRGKSGPQRKTVVVNGNFEPTTMILRFQGEVVKE